MTKINPNLHDQWLREREQSGDPYHFPDFPTWLLSQHLAIQNQLNEINHDAPPPPEKKR